MTAGDADGADARARALDGVRPVTLVGGGSGTTAAHRGPLAVGPRLARGLVTTVYRADLDGREAVLKVFAPRSVRRHAERHRLGIAEFEHRRNAAFHSVPGLARYVAEPLGFVERADVCAVVQERIHGESYYALHRRRGARPPGVFERLERIVETAHAAGLYDLDLHALNVLVEAQGGEEIPRLFDFNRIPFHERPRNPLESLALRLGLVDRGSRDRRKLRQFHRYRRLDPRIRGGSTV